MRFAEKVIVVTGAGSGIGAATAALFAREGAILSLADINSDSLATQAKGLSTRGPAPLQSMIDVSNQDQAEKLIASTVEHFGRLDVLVNNAGLGILGRVTELSARDWRKMFSVDVDGIFFASRAAIPHLIRTKGSIVNVSSISGLFGDHGLAGYNAAKGAVVNLTRAMAVDHGEEGIRVNAVCPGSIATPATAPLHADARVLNHYTDAIPLGRAGKPEEIAEVIAFLASSQASYVNGHCLVADGGLTASGGQPNLFRLLLQPASK
jgi:meso-butanediol dehydrogenase / (S,S)-butanediol dehydrogenase / diacetyl reductase